MANRREYDMLFSLNAQLGSSYTGTFTKAQQQLIAMQKEIEALSRTQSDITAYQKQQTAIEATKKKLEVLQQQYDNIQKEMAETEGYSSALENKLLSKQQQIDKTSASLDAQTAKLGQMGGALRAAGVDTDNLEKETRELGAQIDDVKRKQEEAADEAENFGAVAFQAFGVAGQALAAAGIVKALNEIYEYFMACADAAIIFESDMTGVAKTTDFTQSEFRAISAALKEMTTDIPATTTELAEIAEAAGQLGIVKNSLLDFTEIMAMLGTATNMTSSEAATMLAQLTSITGMDPAFYSNLGSAIVALGNNYATTEKNIADMSQTIAAAGSIAEMSEADIIGISAAVTSLGISAQNGGTQMTKLISEINSAVSSGKDLEAWAAVARMSGDDFATAWGSNAAGALDLFIRGLNETYRSGQDVYGVLSDLGITETRMVTMMTSLAKSGDRLTNTLSTANDAWAKNTALTTEAEKRYATTQSQLILMQNAYNNLQVAIGDAYTPTLREAYAVGADVLSEVAEFIERNPELVRTVTAAAGVFLAATTAVTGFNAAVKIFNTLKLAALLPAGPIMVAIAGVALLTAGVVALSSATDEEAEEVRQLTEASREQYFHIQELNAEYEHAVSAYGDASDEARHLRWEIKDLTDEYEYSKQTVEQFSKEIEASVQANAELIQGYRSATDEIDKQEYNVSTLINRLSELVGQNDLTDESQQRIKATVDALNQALPELSLNYDDAINGGADFVENLKAMAQAEASRQRYQQSHAVFVDLLIKEAELGRDAANALDQKESAQERYNQASQKYRDMLLSQDEDGIIYGTPELKELKAAEAALQGYAESYDSLNFQIGENTAAQEKAWAVMQEHDGVVGEATEGNKKLQTALHNTKNELDELISAYNDAYEAALESVQGQYSLWDEAAAVIATSVGTINKAMESQITYWQDYNANLALLSSKSEDIEGLGDILASFADGSEESVNVVAGIANALKKGDTDSVIKMVANWKELQVEQKAVSDSLVTLETDFAEKMKAMQQELETTISDMSLGAEAAQAGKDTIQGFINGSNEMLPQVEAAYAKIMQAALDSIGANSGNGSGNYTAAGMERYNYIHGSHAEGLDYVPFDGYIAMLHKGEGVVTAEENALRADGGGYGGSSPHISLGGMTFNIGAEVAANNDSLRATLYEAGGELAKFIFEQIDEHAMEKARRGYR